MKHQQKHKQRRLLNKSDSNYDKLSYRDKILLLKRVVIDQQQIKTTASHSRINYSTAKTFLRKFNNSPLPPNTIFIENVYNWFIEHDQAKSRCGYKVIPEDRDQAPSPMLFKQASQKSSAGSSEPSWPKEDCPPSPNKPNKHQITIMQQIMFE